MTGTSVNPPPLNVPIVDPDGRPTRAMVDFINALWRRTGGHDDDLNSLLQLMSGGGYRPEVNQTIEQSSVQQDVVQLSLQGSGAAAAHDATRGIAALLHTQAERHASEIQALRQEIDTLRHELRYATSGQAVEADESADTAQALLFSLAMPQSTAY